MLPEDRTCIVLLLSYLILCYANVGKDVSFYSFLEGLTEVSSVCSVIVHPCGPSLISVFSTFSFSYSCKETGAPLYNAIESDGFNDYLC